MTSMPSSDFVRWSVPLVRSRESARPISSSPTKLHGLASAWLDAPKGGGVRVDGLASGPDHHAPAKPWSVTPVHPADGQWSLQLGTAGVGCARRLLTTCREGQQFTLRGEHLTVGGPPTPVRSASFDSLRRGASRTPDTWTVTFRSPTGFRSRRLWSPLPDPTTIFRSVSSRMMRLFPDERPIDYSERRSSRVRVTSLSGKSINLELEDCRACGFVGEVEFRCADEEVARDFDLLLHVASFLGLGSYSHWTMGWIEFRS